MRRLWHSADITTFNPGQPRATCLITQGSQILAVGDDELAEHWRSHVTETVDLGGRAVVPALCDSHIHLVEHGRAMAQIPLEHCRSAAEAVRTMVEKATEGDGWLIGTGFQINHFDDGVEPHRRLLDEHFPNRPVLLRSRCLHQSWVNTVGLKATGVTASTPNPEGGVIVRDSDGEPTGVFQEEAIGLIHAAIPEPTEADLREAVTRATLDLWSKGITGVHAPESRDYLHLLSRMRSEDSLLIRTHFLPPYTMAESLAEAGLFSGYGDDWLDFGGLKVFLDGALGSQTALMNEPYANAPGNRGVEVMPLDEFKEITEWAHQHRWTMAVHAIGDLAIDRAVEVLSVSQDLNARDDGPMDRIEHFQCFSDGAARRAGKARIAAMMQPIHLFDDWQAVDTLWGEERARRTYACRSLLEAGVPIALGSDAPVASTDPWQSIHATVKRQDLARKPDGGWQPQEALTAEECLKAYSLIPALVAGQFPTRGLLAAGALADFAVLALDPHDPDIDWLQQRVDMTVLAGTIAYDRQDEFEVDPATITEEQKTT